MKRTRFILIRPFLKAFILLFLIVMVLISGCNKRTSSKVKGDIPNLPDVTIISITDETAMAPHKKVTGVINNNINFELLLPRDWNGKFVFGGGGGFVGSVINTALGYGVVQKGYATVGTDTGHEGHPADASWALNDLEAIVNFGHLAVHRTTVTAKAIIEAYYQKEIDYSYFFGCSRGGGQALMEAQRYPDDFDGIVSGAPAYNWTDGIGAGMTHNQQLMFPNSDELGEAKISKEDLQIVENAILDACDELDGIKDGILNNPLACDFDLSTLICEDGNSENCLSAEKIAAMQSIYDGPKDKKGNDIFYGFPYGGETDPGGWFKWITGGLNHIEEINEFQSGVTSEHEAVIIPNAQYGFGPGVLKYMIYHDKEWNIDGYDLNDLAKDASMLAPVLNATDPDISAFRYNGGKLLMYTGWSDAAITALGTIGYYDKVLEHDPSAEEDVKLFMMPGVLHCAGGEGPWWVNWVDEIDKWVTSQEAPEQLPVYFMDEQMQPAGSRLLCAYPEVAIYDGKGDTRDVKSFSCGQ